MTVSPLTAFLISQPDVAAKLLAQHVNDGHGRCRVCTVGGQHGHMPWPCTLYASALHAMQIIEGRP
jgi:hypothetical protein